MPKRAAASTLLVAATKCSSIRVPPWATNQARAVSALVIVSGVVKVLLATTKSVSAGTTRARTEARSAPSTLATKWKVRPGCATSARARTAICGPRSLPPMPMLTTWRRRAGAVPSARTRTLSAKASMASRTAWTSALNGALPRGARSAVWSTARRSVVLIAAPASIASRCASTLHSRARSARKRSVAASTRFFDRSAKSSGASNDIVSKRRGSRANASRRSKSRPCASKWPASAAQAAVRSQRVDAGRPLTGEVVAYTMAARKEARLPVDHARGAEHKGLRKRDTDGAGGAGVQHELEFGRLLDRQVARPFTLEDATGVFGHRRQLGRHRGRVRSEPAPLGDGMAQRMDRRQPVLLGQLDHELALDVDVGKEERVDAVLPHQH